MPPPPDAELPARAVSVLFVCLGNICRSPMAEAVFADRARSHPLVARVDSCGTAAYHLGAAPDPRTLHVLSRHGLGDYAHAARQLRPRDLLDFDFVFGMDAANLRDLRTLSRRAARERRPVADGAGPSQPRLAELRLWGDFGEREGGRAGGEEEEVQDPYYGPDDAFEVVYEQMTRFTDRFLHYLEAQQACKLDEGRP